MKKVLLLIVLILVVAAGIIFLMKKRATDGVTPAGEQNTEQGAENAQPVIERAPFPKEFENDVDQDGLTNEEEKTLQTSEVETDTDGDGISDALEVQKWKTDPLKVDTDGDGFSDLIEIMGGYNPAGPGKITQ